MITALIEALAFGTFWFWLLAFISSIVIIACVENEHYPFPSILLIVLGAIYWKPIVAMPWQTILVAIGIFAVVGLLWSAFKWHRYITKIAREYRERNGNILPESCLRDLKNAMSVSRHKAMLTGWIAFWPWSMLWSLTGDFFNMLYDAMTNVYQKITDNALSKFEVEKPRENIIADANDDHRTGRNRPESY